MDNVLSILDRERVAAQFRVDELSVEMRDLRQRVREIDDAMAVLSGHTPALRPVRGSGGKLQTLILACLKAYGAGGANVREIAASLAADGRETSEPSVSSTLSRMKSEGDVENRNGKWFAPNDDYGVTESQGGAVAHHRQENEAPSGIPLEPQKPAEWGVQPPFPANEQPRSGWDS